MASKRLWLYPERFEIIDFAIISITVYFGFSTWISWSYGNYQLPLREPIILIETYLSVFLFIGGLLLAKLINKRDYNKNIRSAVFREVFFHVDNIPLKIPVILECFIWIVRIYVGIEYGMFFSGTANENVMAGLPYSIFILISFNIMLAFGCLLWACGTIWRHPQPSRKIVAILCIGAEFIWAFMRGRRWLAEILIFIILGFLGADRHYYLSKEYSRKYNFKVILVAITGSVILMSIFPVFTTTRDVYFKYQRTGNAVVDLFDTFQDMVKEGSETIDYSKYTTNVITRVVSANDFIYSVLDAQKTSDYMFGKGLYNSLLWVIPSLFFEKNKLIPTEQLIQIHYNLPLTDAAITWIALACSDFSILGCIAIGFFIGCIIIGFEKFILFIKPESFMAFIILGSLISFLWRIEEDPVALWGFIRSSIMLWVIQLFIYKKRQNKI